MRKPIVTNDLAHLRAVLMLREHFDGGRKVYEPRKPYSEAPHRDNPAILSSTSNDGVIWYDEASNIDPEAWKELRDRISPADRTHIVYGTWIGPVPCVSPEGKPCTCHLPRIDGEPVAPRQSDFSFLDWLKEDEENDED